MRVPHGSVINVSETPDASFVRIGSSSWMPSASIFLTKACRLLTSKPMWSSTRPLVGACAVSARPNRSWAPGTSTTGALLRVPASPPKVFAYQAWALGISASGTKKCTCSCRIGMLWFLSSRISMRTPSGVTTKA